MLYDIRKWSWIWVVALFASIHVSAQTIETRKYSNEFLALGVDARAFAMSNSIVAGVNDVSAGYWNPAGLTQIQKPYQLGLMHAEYFAGIAKYDYGALALRIDEQSVMGLSIIRFAVDDIPNTTQLIQNGNIDYDRITSFSSADYAFLFSYARKANKVGLSYGGNVKIIRRVVGDFANSWGFGFDLGTQYATNNWKFGAMFRDVTTTFNAWNFTLDDETIAVYEATGNEIPTSTIEVTLPKLILGAGRVFPIGEKFTLFGEVNFDVTFDGKRNVPIKSEFASVDPHAGLEIGFINMIFLRGGVGNFQQVTAIDGINSTTFQPNFGIGLKYKSISLDYALTDIGDNSIALYSNVFSLKVDINRNEK